MRRAERLINQLHDDAFAAGYATARVDFGRWLQHSDIDPSIRLLIWRGLRQADQNRARDTHRMAETRNGLGAKPE